MEFHYFTRSILENSTDMEKTVIPQTAIAELSALNAQFIRNFLNQDAEAHSRIISTDFVCIESNGAIISRETYLKNWKTDLDNSGYASFDYKDEYIRVFGDVALVRAKTVFTMKGDDTSKKGYTIYTDTYVKERGEWKCVQVQITPVK